ncbi:MAG TPA: protein kinase [Polyangiales bacterium]|nr:protein kinase [Polyangiales bacterium]
MSVALDTGVLLAGRYRLLSSLGKGGMGAVYRVHDETLDRVLALKQLELGANTPNSDKLKALFEREYHTLARLKHPRIIEVYDYGVADGGPYYTMELLEGADLQQLAPLPFRDACRVLREVASSLALLHAHRLLHRDVSPRNVRLTADGRAKLIDFGTLTTFGVAGEVIGTPMSMAPEALQRMPLDQRTDLFSLGTLAYWLLTGRPAYPVRSLAELPEAWLRAPRPASQCVPGIPPALDSLCQALLNPDPLARPSSAAAVMDQLTAIAELTSDGEHEQAAESYLSSGRLVGRDLERGWMRQRFERALSGQGSEVVIEGPAGIGRTRLLRELCLDAQLQAITPLCVDAQAVPSAYGVPINLALQLLTVAPEIARRAAESHAAVLAQLSPELRDKLDVPQPAELPADPNERRAQLQTALHVWFTQLGLPLLIAVDNLQVADDDSAAFLASIGRECRRARLVVLVTQRSGEPVTAPGPVRALRKRSGHLKLAGLRAGACEELVKSLFGDVDNAGRIARLLHERSAGNPRQCMDLAQLLVQKRIARYDAGSWHLPHEVSGDELPDRIEEVLQARLGALSPNARNVAEALCVHATPVALERCRTLAAEVPEREIYAALDELVADQILIAERGQYRFEHPGLREAIRARLDDDRRRALHLRAAQTLRDGKGAGERVEAAWHVMHSGDELLGADMLAEAGREFLRSDGAQQQSVEQVVRALDAALNVYERHGRSRYELAGLMFTLIPLAFFVDRRVTLKYAERAVQLGLQITGLALAAKLRRFLGKKLGLMLGLAFASLCFAHQSRRGLRFDLREAIGAFCGIVPAAVGTHNICYDIATVSRLTSALEPLRLFGPDHVATWMHDFARGQLAMCQGRESEARELLEGLDRRFRTAELREELGSGHWKAMYGGILFSLGILYPYELGEHALDTARALEQLSVRVWTMAADQVRMLFHALRGESERVSYFRERVELAAVQGSTTWQAEMLLPVLLLGAELLSKDTIGARRIWEKLARRARETPSLEVYARAARAAYLALRGESGTAIALYEALLPELAPRTRVAWQTIRAHYAEALIAAGEPERAKALLEETLAQASEADLRMLGRFLEPQRQLALATAALGDHAGAVQQLEALILRHAESDQPLLVGLLHKARAEVALQMRDLPAFERHLAALEACFRGTQNSALIAQWEQLIEAATRAGLRAPAPGRSLLPDGRSRAPAPGMHHLHTAANPHAYALRLILRGARANEGFLYGYDGARMQLSAASGTQEPPRDLEKRLNELAQRLEFEAVEPGANPHAPFFSRAPAGSAQGSLDVETQLEAAPSPDNIVSALEVDDASEFVVSEPSPDEHNRFQTIVLSTQRDGRICIVGGAIVQAAIGGRVRIDRAFLADVASALHDRLNRA